MLTKQDFIALADAIRDHNQANDSDGHFTPQIVESLADFCAAQNPRFNRARWLAYIAGTQGPNGGVVKGGAK